MNLDIDGYSCVHIPGNKSKRSSRGRCSGGISVYYKTDLKIHISIVEKQQCGIIWIKLSSVLFPFNDDVYICHVYIPPTTSNLHKTMDNDLYDQLEIGIIKYNNLGQTFLTGDWNSRC